MATNPYSGMNLVNTWDPMTGLYYDQSGNEVTEDEFYRQQFTAGSAALGAIPFTAEEQAAMDSGRVSIGSLQDAHPGYGFYNGGNGAAVWAPLNDPNFMPKPQAGNDSFLSTWTPGNDATPEMHGGAAIMAMPFIAAGLAAAGAVGAGGGALAGESGAGALIGAGEGGAAGGLAGDAALAGGGEVGSGYAASAPGWGAAGDGGAALAGGGEVGSGYASSAPGSGGADPYGLGVDQYGNPTGQYADSTFQGGQPDTTNYGDTSPGLLKQAQDLAKQYGITPQSALNYLKQAIGRGAPAVLGAVAANRQADSLADLAKQYMDLGGPSRARYEASYAPGFTMANDPGYTDALNQTSKASMHALSVNGNPAGSPNAWDRSMQDIYEKTAYPALQNFRNQNASTGGIASFSAAAPTAASGAITAQGNVFNAVGAAANDIFNPKPSLAQTLADYKRMTGTV